VSSVPRRRHQTFIARVAGTAGELTLALWTPIVRRPVDSVAIITAVTTALIIVVNAIFLQSSMKAPPFVEAKSPSGKSDSVKPLVTGSSGRPVAAPAMPLPVAARRNDAITELIGPSARIAGVQRALSEYGYGQIKPSGILDNATSAAIEKFERDHNLPSTGRVSDRLLKELAAMVGHPIE
jgi:hypothetical protein